MPNMQNLAAEIAAAGNKHVFGITGSGISLVLADELERRGVSFVRTQFEGVAAMMAGTIGRLSGRAGVSLGIKGPGLVNMVPGLAVSWFESFPLVAIVEAYGPKAGPTKAHKRVDHHTLVQPVSKGVRLFAEGGPGFADMARWAEAEVPAPVVLELTGGKEVPPPPCPDSVLAPAGDVARVLAMIDAAQRPVVIAGTLALRKGWSGRLNALVIPCFSTAAAKGVINETLPHAAGPYTGVGLELATESTLLRQADLVVCLGVRPGEVLATIPLPCPAVAVEAVAGISGAEGFVYAETIADTHAGAVFDSLQSKDWGLDALAECLRRMDARLTAGPFLPAGAFAVMAQHFGRDVCMAMDTGYFCTIGEHVWRAPRADLCLMSGQGRYMGTGVPMALAAALHDRSRPTVAVLGDGGIGMYAAELRLAVEQKLPLLVVLMTDGRFSSIATRALKDSLTLKPLTMSDPSWVAAMAGLGLPGRRVERPESLAEVLAAWDPTQGPAYVEIAFAADPYEQMVAGIR